MMQTRAILIAPAEPLPPSPVSAWRALAGSIALAVMTAGIIAVMLWLVGPPRPPHLPPDWDHIRRVLQSDRPSPSDVAAVLLPLAWSLLGYLAVVATLRLIGDAAACLLGMARAAAALGRLTNRLTLPPLRRLIDGAATAVVVAGPSLTAPAGARLDPVSIAQTVVHTAPPPEFAAPPTTADGAVLTVVFPDRAWPAGEVAAEVSWGTLAVDYTVAAGDTVWDIARRCYGDGRRFPEIVAANRGRTMTDGAVFTDPDRIRPGWVLTAPLAAEAPSLIPEGIRYQVEEGDSLWGIAARFLGDGPRWTEIWDLNQGQDLGDGRPFTAAGSLWPGTTLRLPVVVRVEQPPTPAPVYPVPAPPPPSSPAARPAAASPSAVTPAPAASAPEEDALPAAPATPVARPAVPGPRLTVPAVPAVPAVPLHLVAGAAGLAATGVAAALVAGRVRHRAASGVRGAVAAPARGPHRRRRGAGKGGGFEGSLERVRDSVELLLDALAEQGFDRLRLLSCRESAGALSVLIACPPGDGAALAAARFTLARRLACELDAEARSDQRVRLTVRGLRRQAAVMVAEGGAGRRPVLLVPAGAAPDAVQYLDLAGAGSVRITGPEAAIGRLLRGWRIGLAATCPEYRYWIAVDPTLADAHLTAVGETPGHPPDRALARSSAVGALHADLRDRLAAEDGGMGEPVILLVAAAGEPGGEDELETLVWRGGAAGITTILVGGDDPATAPMAAEAWMATITLAGEGEVAPDAPAVGAVRFGVHGGEVAALREIVITDAPWATPSTVEAPLPPPTRVVDPPHAPEQAAPIERGDSPVGATDDEPADARAASPADVRSLASAGGPRTPAVRIPSTDAAIGAGADAVSVDPAALAPAEPMCHACPTCGAVCRVTLDVTPLPAVPTRAVSGEAGGGAAPAVTDDSGPAVDEAQADGAPLSAGDARPATDDDNDPNDASDEDGVADEQVVAPRFTVRCFGDFQVEVGGAPVINWKVQKARELLAFVLARGGASVSREEVFEALWPEGDADQMSKVLPGVVYHLRRTLRDAGAPVDPLPVLGQRYHPRTELFQTDLAAFTAHLARADALPPREALVEYDRALKLCPQSLYATESFEWAGRFRQLYDARYRGAAHTAARLALDHRDIHLAAECFRGLLLRDPLDEEAVRGLMRCFVATGDRGGARKVYRTLEGALRRELDDPTTAPMPETTAYLEELLGNSPAQPK